MNKSGVILYEKRCVGLRSNYGNAFLPSMFLHSFSLTNIENYDNIILALKSCNIL